MDLKADCLDKRFRKNLPKHYWFSFLTSFNIDHGIWMLFLASKGMNFFQIGLMETIFHATSFLMEVPTGAIADIYGRKLSRTLGRIAYTCSTALILFGNEVWVIGLAFALTALSYNLESGAGDALIFDSLKQIGQEKTYVRLRGRTEMIFQIATVFSLLLGGYLATQNYRTVYLVGIALGIVSVLSALTFTEPTIGQVKRSSNALLGLKEQVFRSFSFLKNHRRVSGIILLSEVFGVFGTTLFFYSQNFYKSQGFNEFQIGMILAAGGVLAAVTAIQSAKIKELSAMSSLMVFLSLLGMICFWGVLIPTWGVAFFWLLTITESVMFVLTGDYVNQAIPSQQRATILSLQSMFFSFLMMLVFPAVGKLSDLFNLQTALSAMAGLASLSLFLLVMLILRYKSLLNQPAAL